MESDIGPTMKIAGGLIIQSTIKFPSFPETKIDCRTLLSQKVSFQSIFIIEGVILTHNSKNKKHIFN